MELPTPIPFAIEPTFLILLLIIGRAFAVTPLKGAIAGVVGALSIIAHELAHALTARAFGCRPKISLIGTGGLTEFEHSKLNTGRELVLYLSGPLSTFLICGCSLLALRSFELLRTAPWFDVLADAYGLNLVWGILNLAPILPFDGGQALQLGLASLFNSKGYRYMRVWSVVGCFLMMAWAVWRKDWFFAGVSYFMAITNARMVLMLRHMSDEELRPDNQRLISRVAELEQEEKHEEAYALLSSLEPILGLRNRASLALLACATKRYQKAVEVCEPLYSQRPDDPSICFALARAYAGLGESKAAGQWLNRAISGGLRSPRKAVADCPEFAEMLASGKLKFVGKPLIEPATKGTEKSQA